MHRTGAGRWVLVTQDTELSPRTQSCHPAQSLLSLPSSLGKEGILASRANIAWENDPSHPLHPIPDPFTASWTPPRDHIAWTFPLVLWCVPRAGASPSQGPLPGGTSGSFPPASGTKQGSGVARTQDQPGLRTSWDSGRAGIQAEPGAVWGGGGSPLHVPLPRGQRTPQRFPRASGRVCDRD